MKQSGKEPNQRVLRVGELVRHALAEILTRGPIREPVLEGVSITVTQAEVSPDLRHAVVRVMPLGGENKEAIADALQRHRKFLRAELGRAVTLKFLPELEFRLDRSFDAADHIDALLKEPRVAQDLGTRDDGADNG